MGPPGSGKTTVGRLLGAQLGMPVVDVDNDFLEPLWGMTVSQKLAELGDEGFLEAEGQATLGLNSDQTVISMTGSNPLHKQGMDHLAQVAHYAQG
jgi:shikimate kinase